MLTFRTRMYRIGLISFIGLSLTRCAIITTSTLDNDPVESVVRQNYLNSQNRISTQPDHIRQAMLDGNLTLGMNMDEVKMVWGEPAEVDVAGNPQLGNQRWLYPGGLLEKSPIESNRIVFFENGKVSGWKTARF